MKCPFFQSADISVKDSRNTAENIVIRRRRYCSNCGGRFTTFERIQIREFVVIKRTGHALTNVKYEFSFRYATTIGLYPILIIEVMRNSKMLNTNNNV